MTAHDDRNFWGKIPSNPTAPTPPPVLLKEQARLLTGLTGGKLVGDVSLNPGSPFMWATLIIRVPALGGWTKPVLTVWYPESGFPLSVVDELTKAEHPASTDAAYTSVVRDILTSERVRRLLSHLLSQAEDNETLGEEETDDD